MNKYTVLLVTVLICAGCFAQSGIVEEAKTAITKKHHDAMVEKAKTLLERKTRLETALAETNSKLAKLDAGQDVKLGAEPETEFGEAAVAWPTATTALTCCGYINSTYGGYTIAPGH